MADNIKTTWMKAARFFESIKLNNQNLMLVLAIIVGIGAAFASVLVQLMIKFFHWFFFDFIQGAMAFMGNYAIVLLPALGGLIVGPLVIFFAREAKGHGIPEVMAAVALRGGRIRPRVALVKSLASSICIGSGGAVGREGPVVQIGSSLGSMIGQFFRMSDFRIKTFVACGSAGAISATFNAPIAGVMFAMEIILGEFAASSFGLILISSVSAVFMSHYLMGNLPAYILVTQYSLLNYWELFLYVLLGFLAGGFSVVYIKVLTFFEDQFIKIKGIPEYILPALGGLLLGILALFYPQVLGIGNQLVGEVLNGSFPILLLIILMVAKLLATSLTLGSGGSGGVFAPGLFMGAMLGAAFGNLVNLLFPGFVAPAGAYALVGMAAVFAGSTRATITAVIMLFEMTNDYSIIPPLMVTCVISSIVSANIHKESIYTIKLARKGINLISGRKKDVLESIQVEKVMVKKVETVSMDLTVKEMVDFMHRSKHHGYPVVDEKEELVGVITFQDVSRAIINGMEKVKIEEIMSDYLVTVYPDESLNRVTQKFVRRDLSRLPVVSRQNDKKILGIITNSDIIAAYDRSLTFSEVKLDR